ncbi:MAG: AAA family ATPase [Bacteroidota bacterium]
MAERRKLKQDDRRSDELRLALGGLKQFAKIMEPADAEPPILTHPVQQALIDWMAELNYHEKLAAVGIKPRRTAMLYGIPGSGKTTFAHHFAARLGKPLVCVQSEDLISKYLGETGSNIGRLFSLAEPVADEMVILFDEFDALGSRRSTGGAAIDKERNQILTVLLRRVEQYEGLVIAATNIRGEIDPAMQRRFDLQVEIGLPDEDCRFAIIRRYFAPFELSDEDTDLLTELTVGCSPALIKQLMEGVKRYVVLAPVLRRSVQDPVEVFKAVLVTVQPPTLDRPNERGELISFDLPPLWDGKKNIEEVRHLSWPPRQSEPH